MNSTSKILLVALGGVVLGATAGILLAPKSGKETRKDLANKINQLKTQIADMLAKGSDTASETIDAMKEKLSAMEEELSSTEKA